MADKMTLEELTSRAKMIAECHSVYVVNEYENLDVLERINSELHIMNLSEREKAVVRKILKNQITHIRTRK